MECFLGYTLQGRDSEDAKAAGEQPGNREATEAALEKVCSGRAECIQQIQLMCGQRLACIMGVVGQVTQPVCSLLLTFMNIADLCMAEHPYHLVDPRPWPLLASLTCLLAYYHLVEALIWFQ